MPRLYCLQIPESQREGSPNHALSPQKDCECNNCIRALFTRFNYCDLRPVEIGANNSAKYDWIAPRKDCNCNTCERMRNLVDKREVLSKIDRRLYRLQRQELPLDYFEKKFEEQNGCCAICSSTFTEELLPQRNIDPSTGQYRGLLCHVCNQGTKDIKYHIAALRYLLKWEPQIDNLSAKDIQDIMGKILQLTG